MYHKTVLLLTLSLTTFSSQAAVLFEQDTVKLVDGSRLQIDDQKIKIKQDTTIIIPQGVDYKIRYPRGTEGDLFFDSLQVRANRKQWTQRLHNIVVREPRRLEAEDTVHTRLSTEPYLTFAGKTIRSISFSKLPPFGYSINDTIPAPLNRMEQFGNELHRITQDRVLRNYLLFHEGDFVDPNELADNERLIRRLPFIQDAVFLVRETTTGSDSVDIILATKDVFFLGLGGEITDISSGNFKIFDPNLFGMGQELHMVFHWDGEKNPLMGNEVFYIAHNLDGSFIDAKMRYASIFDLETYKFGLNRKFFTPEIKYAGALDLESTRMRRNIDFLDTLTDPVTIKYKLLDGWIGRSFHLKKQNNLTRNRMNLVIATRFYSERFIERPDVSENTLYRYHNKTGWLSSIAFSSQSFFRSNLILDFGRTEDIPQGILFNFTFGPEKNDFDHRIYTGISFSQGRYLGNIGYLYTRVEGGGFLKKPVYFEQGVINMKGNYFSNLFIINRFKVRYFISASYVRGIRRFEDEIVNLKDENGIRGFRYSGETGTQKLSLNYEASAFTPFYLYGFRFVFFGFADAGIVGSDIEPFNEGQFYSGFGMGVRIRNERLIFETISIRLGFYPNYPDNDLPLFIDVAGRERLNPENFRVGKPRIIGFR